jgi:hypothetical protein
VAIQSRKVSPWGFIGVAGMVSVLFLYGASGLLAPPWAVVVLLLVWLAMFVQTCRWFESHPKRTVVMTGVAVVVWFTAIVAGGVLLDWSA